MAITHSLPVSRPKSPSNSRPVTPVPKPYWFYRNILPEYKHLYTQLPKTPPSSPKQSPTNNNPSPPSLNNNNNNNPASGGKRRKSVGGVNLTPLISALLLAGIKLALEQKKKAKSANAVNAAKTTKSATSKSTKATKPLKPLKRQRKTI